MAVTWPKSFPSSDLLWNTAEELHLSSQSTIWIFGRKYQHHLVLQKLVIWKKDRFLGWHVLVPVLIVVNLQNEHCGFRPKKKNGNVSPPQSKPQRDRSRSLSYSPMRKNSSPRNNGHTNGRSKPVEKKSEVKARSPSPVKVSAQPPRNHNSAPDSKIQRSKSPKHSRSRSHSRSRKSRSAERRSVLATDDCVLLLYVCWVFFFYLVLFICFLFNYMTCFRNWQLFCDVEKAVVWQSVFETPWLLLFGMLKK